MSASPGALSSVPAAPESFSAPWRILVVEPTPEGRAAVFFALQDVELLGRPLLLVPAGTTVEACRIVRSAEAPAVALIDVGEEGPAALEVLLGRVRAQAPAEMRLVLWVRHPSQIPPLSMLTRHDVSDVCRRSDLTQGRLLIVLHVTLCAYEQRLRLRYYREGVVEALVALEDPRSRGRLETLARGLLLQITGLLGGDGSALVASGPGSDAAADPIGFVVLGGCGRFAGLSGTSVSSQRGEGGLSWRPLPRLPAAPRGVA
ncbi:hypothetical protein [Pararhodospirillum photometricum]|nr:hypothetical protein [Pararhodospirillum photometricum]